MTEVCSGRDYKHLNEGPIPVYGTGGYMTSVDEALSYDKDAIGIGRKGTIDKPYRLRAPFWTVDTLFYSIPRPGIDIDFALCSFLNVDWKSKDESTGLPSLSKEAINETLVRLPSANEQAVIGRYFAGLDSLITLHQGESNRACGLIPRCPNSPSKRDSAPRNHDHGAENTQLNINYLNEHLVQHCLLDVPEQLELTLMKSDEGIELSKATRNCSLLLNT